MNPEGQSKTSESISNIPLKEGALSDIKSSTIYRPANADDKGQVPPASVYLPLSDDIKRITPGLVDGLSSDSMIFSPSNEGLSDSSGTVYTRVISDNKFDSSENSDFDLQGNYSHI